MPLITRTSNQIIENAFKIIGLFAEDIALENGRMVEGLYNLNILLSQYASSPEKIAYNSNITFNLVPNQREYSISKAIGADVNSNRLVSIKYLTLKSNDIIYPVDITDDEFYINRTRTDTFKTLPRQCYLQNEIEGSIIVFFQIPDQVYECRIKGKFTIDEVELSQVLDEVPNYYHGFLEYALAKQLHSKYKGSSWDANDEETYRSMLNDIKTYSDIDNVSETGSALNKCYYGDRRSAFFGGY